MSVQSKAVTRSASEMSSSEKNEPMIEPMIEETVPGATGGDPSNTSSSSSSGETQLLMAEKKKMARRISRQKRNQERELLRQEVNEMKEELESLKSGVSPGNTKSVVQNGGNDGFLAENDSVCPLFVPNEYSGVIRRTVFHQPNVATTTAIWRQLLQMVK